MTADPRALAELLEESQDLQADALRPTHEALDELVETAHAQQRMTRQRTSRSTRSTQALTASLAGAALLGAAGGAALVGVLASAASASSSSDVQILQTAASIENLAVATYKTALTLPYIGGSAANPVVTKFAQVTMGQHAQHADAFNAAIKSLGGKAQNKPDPAFVPVVNKAVASLGSATAAQGALGVVGLALELENIAAETYVKDTTLAKSDDEQGAVRLHHGNRSAARQRAPGRSGPSHGRRTAADLAVARHGGRAAGSGGNRWLPQRVLQDQHGRPGQARSRQVSKTTKKYRGQRERAACPDAELDELHHDVGMPAMARGPGRLHGRAAPADAPSCWAPAPPWPVAQRWSSVGACPTLAAASTRRARPRQGAAFPPAGLTGDLAVAAVAASLENLAVFAYTAGLSAATAASWARCPRRSPPSPPRSKASTSSTPTRGTVC